MVAATVGTRVGRLICLLLSVLLPTSLLTARAESAANELTSRKLVELNNLTDGTLSLSPDGRFIAYQMRRADIDNDTYHAAWFVVPTTGSVSPKMVDDAGDPLLFRAAFEDGSINGDWLADRPVWSPASDRICYRKRVALATQIWCADMEGRATQVTHNESDVEAFVWATSGSKLLFIVDAPRNVRRESERVEANSGYLYTPDQPWSLLDGRPLVARYALLNGKGQVWAYDLSAEIERLASVSEGAEFRQLTQLGGMAQGPEGTPHARVVARTGEDLVAWLEADTPGQRGRMPPMSLHSASGGGGKRIRTCAAEICRGILGSAPNAYLRWSEDGQEVFFTRREGLNYGRVLWYAWNPATGKVRTVADTTNDGITDCSFHGDTAFCFSQSPSYPRTLVSLDLKAGRISTLVDVNPTFKSIELGRVERLEWSDPQGNSTFAFLVLPRNYVPGTRYPLVITGYRASAAFRGGVGDEYPTHVFSANGFAVLVYDMPEAWDVMARVASAVDVVRQTWNGSRFELSAPLSLLQAAIQLLDERGLIDPTRVGITGLSTGASHVNFALTKSRYFRAAIVSQPPWTRLHYFLSTSGSAYRSILRQLGLGAPGSGEDALAEALVLSKPPFNLHTPLLINASEAEYVPALETVITLREADQPVELRVYPDEYHIKWHPQHRFHIYERNLAWMTFWLKRTEIAAGKTNDQYRQWQQLGSVTTTQVQ